MIPFVLCIVYVLVAIAFYVAGHRHGRAAGLREPPNVDALKADVYHHCRMLRYDPRVGRVTDEIVSVVKRHLRSRR